MIRLAFAVEIPRLTELMVEGAKRSSYWKDKESEIDVQATKQMFMAAIQRHMNNGIGSSCVLVPDHDGQITGFLVGAIDRLYGLGTKFEASMLYHYVTPGAPPRDAGALVDAFDAWWAAKRNVARAHCAATNFLGGDFDRAAQIYRRRGYEQSGAIFSKDASHVG